MNGRMTRVLRAEAFIQYEEHGMRKKGISFNNFFRRVKKSYSKKK